MCNVQKWRKLSRDTTPSLVIESRNHRLSSSGRCNDEVAVLSLHLTLSSEDVEDFFLKRIRVQVKHRKTFNADCAFPTNRLAQSLRACLCKRLELVVTPIGFE